MVVKFDGFEKLQQRREESVHVFRLYIAQAELEPHDASVFGEEGGTVVLTGRLDDCFGTGNKRSTFLGCLYAFGSEDWVIGVETAEELGGVFGEADEIPPNYGGLVLI